MQDLTLYKQDLTGFDCLKARFDCLEVRFDYFPAKFDCFLAGFDHLFDCSSPRFDCLQARFDWVKTVHCSALVGQALIQVKFKGHNFKLNLKAGGKYPMKDAQGVERWCFITLILASVGK